MCRDAYLQLHRDDPHAGAHWIAAVAAARAGQS
jgi:hypothetical protein